MPLLVINRKEDLRKFVQEQRIKQAKVGFVPTMGALHSGHEALIKQSVLETDVSIVSIFVNPKQFGQNEDLSKYPRQFQSDYELCESNGIHALFAPSVAEMYSPEFCTQISVPSLNHFMCGKFRPGHFDGVATVVMLLLNIVQPHFVYLGQKDFQQVQIIKRMCKDLYHDSNIIMVPTVREKDGLALSSRNVYLNTNARELAKTIPQALASAAKLYLSGERDCEKIIKTSLKSLEEKNLSPQYLELRSFSFFEREIHTKIEEDCVLAIAQFVSSEETQVRLIDNIILSEDSIWKEVLNNLINSVNY